jgi:2-polyprenyl-6-methoxyphenol hydroxylase-like FAD-dependent oxidoreductase
MADTNRASAVVLGASMAGLATARALADHFERVTVVERDALTAAIEGRKGVPQSNHAHGLLPSGYRILDAWFPGMMADLIAIGAMPGDLTGDFLWYQYGRWKLRVQSDLGGIVVTRPMLESKVRERVRALPNIVLLDGHDIDEPIFDAASGRVTGARVTRRSSGEPKIIAADLVIDTTGRGSQSPVWLSKWGFGDVEETHVRIDVGYSTAIIPRRSGDLYGAMGAIIAGTVPESKRFAAILGAEGDRWVVTLVGAIGDYPPTDLASWREFGRSLPTPHTYELVKDREPLMSIQSYRFPANRQRHFERLKRFPLSYLVLGDAVCSFNPIYGQGMSVSLCEANALDECLSQGDDGLARRFFAKISPIVASPWAIATGEDYRFPQVEGRRPPGHGMISRYMARTHRAANRDPVVLKRFFEVASLLAPPTAMMSPAIAWRVLLGGIGAPQGDPAARVRAETAVVASH